MRMETESAVKTAAWFEQNQRDLPWRNTGDPYHVWISEIMLQQTRIEAVIAKYTVFVHELPDIRSLAECEDDRLMRLWEGLGYYSRARNLKKCAQVLVKDHSGCLPRTRDELARLPGIGPYTAGAIASIAFGEPVPAVDGNVLRILARYFLYTEDIRSAKTKQELEQALRPVYAKKAFSPSSFNQGLMEIGQTVCIPAGQPDCTACPLSAGCRAYREGRTGEVPYRSRPAKRRVEQRTLIILRDKEHFLLHKRSNSGLLAGLYEFPALAGHLDEEAIRQIYADTAILHIHRLPDARHLFSHIEWDMIAYEVMTDDITALPLAEDCAVFTKKEMAETAIPSAFQVYIRWYGLRDH